MHLVAFVVSPTIRDVVTSLVAVNAHAIIARLSENLRDSLESAETTAALRAVQRSIVNHKGPLELVDGRRELLAQAEVTSGVLKKKYVFQLQ